MLHLTQRVYHKKLYNGLFLYVNAADHIQQTIFWYGYYEKDVSQLWQRLVLPGSHIIDIGANMGYFSVLAGAKATAGRVISFEPVLSFRHHLQRNLTLNNLSNVLIVPYCVSDANGPTQLYLSDAGNTGMSSLHPPENFSGYTETVQTIRLDDWLKDNYLPQIDLIKLDIEGSEKKALDGMRCTLARYKPMLLIEIINANLQKFGHSATAVYAALRHLGYEAYLIINGNTLQKINDDRDGYDVLFLPPSYQLLPGITVI